MRDTSTSIPDPLDGDFLNLSSLLRPNLFNQKKLGPASKLNFPHPNQRQPRRHRDALSTLDSKLSSSLISLSADERRRLNKMCEKSEPLPRTLIAMSENPGLTPTDVGMIEAQRDNK